MVIEAAPLQRSLLSYMSKFNCQALQRGCRVLWQSRLTSMSQASPTGW